MRWIWDALKLIADVYNVIDAGIQLTKLIAKLIPTKISTRAATLIDKVRKAS